MNSSSSPFIEEVGDGSARGVRTDRAGRFRHCLELEQLSRELGMDILLLLSRVVKSSGLRRQRHRWYLPPGTPESAPSGVVHPPSSPFAYSLLGLSLAIDGWNGEV